MVRNRKLLPKALLRNRGLLNTFISCRDGWAGMESGDFTSDFRMVKTSTQTAGMGRLTDPITSLRNEMTATKKPM